jgi:hypothetical protein
MTSDNSRRDFVRDSVVALAALPAFGAVAALAATPAANPAPAAQGDSFKLGKNNLAFLSNSLYNSPGERQKFLADPKGFSEGLFHAKLNPAEASKLENVRQIFASGLCCSGCGCSGAPAPEIDKVLPALKR